MKRHFSYYYQSIFKLTKPQVQTWIDEIESVALKWPGITSEIHSMGGVRFLYHRKEIGHVHWNGDLDIVFGKEITERLLQSGKVSHHRFVPSSAVTFSLNRKEDVDFALALLRFSHLRIIQNKKVSDNAIKNYSERGMENLPIELRLLLDF